MGETTSYQIGRLKRLRKWVRSNLVRLRRAKLRYGNCNLPPEKREHLTNEIEGIRLKLGMLIAAFAAMGTQNRELAIALEVAREVLADCNEMLSLLG